jgi:hypothetical protein
VEFFEHGGELQHCTLTQRTAASAEMADVPGKSIQKLACAADMDIRFRAFGDRLLERCVLADAAKVGPIVCAAGKEIVLSDDGLTACTLASRQWVGPFDLAAETSVGFTQGHLDRFEMSPSSTAVSVSTSIFHPARPSAYAIGLGSLSGCLCPRRVTSPLQGQADWQNELRLR